MALKISRILHAGYVFERFDEKQSTKIIFDPIFENPFSRNCFAYPMVEFDQQQIKKLKFDAIFISHYHDDHCSFESLNFLDRRIPIYAYCLFEELFSMLKELGFHEVHALEIDRPVKIGALEIIPRRALDADVDSMFQIKAGTLNILNVVDAWIDPATLEKLAAQAPWDMVLWPFQTLRELEVLSPSKALASSQELPMEWLPQLKMLNPRYVVPSSCQFVHESWSWYNHALFPISYQQFQQEVEAALPHSHVIRMNPGASFVLNETSLLASSPLSWVIPVGNQDVDYQYQPGLQPPSIAEIARRFVPLTAKQTERVLEYCRQGLIEKYKSLPVPEESCFVQPTIWRLSIYDHDGVVTFFDYRLHNQKIEMLASPNEPITWLTEVSIAKFFAVLEQGETLTSMYLRIENEIAKADAMEDPLIRCLFDGVFGEYQLAQLKRLKENSDIL